MPGAKFGSPGYQPVLSWSLLLVTGAVVDAAVTPVVLADWVCRWAGDAPTVDEAATGDNSTTVRQDSAKRDAHTRPRRN
jgi:hypothetical protein